MKKVLSLVFLFLVVATVAVQAASYHYHAGAKNKFPIGNKDVPAKVYLLFLKDKAIGEKYSLWHYSKYYESDFMDTDWWACNIDCIKQTKVSPPKGDAYYDYSLISGHGRENDIIDALSSQEVQQEFNDWYAEWMKNPTRQELCDYINDTIAARIDASYLEKAEKIESSYPQTMIAETSEQTLWQEIDQIVNRIYAVSVDNPTSKNSCYAQSAQVRLANWGLVFSSDSDASLPPGIPKHVILADASQRFIREAWGQSPFGEWSRTDANGNTYTGETVIDGGTLISVPSLNKESNPSNVSQSPASSL